MENTEEKPNNENFILYTGITVLVLGAVILASLLTQNGDGNIFSDLNVKWKNRKNNTKEEPKEENPAAAEA
jgi:hypothetical protein